MAYGKKTTMTKKGTKKKSSLTKKMTPKQKKAFAGTKIGDAISAAPKKGLKMHKKGLKMHKKGTKKK